MPCDISAVAKALLELEKLRGECSRQCSREDARRKPPHRGYYADGPCTTGRFWDVDDRDDAFRLGESESIVVDLMRTPVEDALGAPLESGG